MDELWVDQLDLITPTLMRAPTSSSVDGKIQEKQAEIVAHGISQMNISIGMASELPQEKNCATGFLHGSDGVFVDEPESYEDPSPPASFWDCEEMFVSSLRSIESCFPDGGITTDVASSDWMPSGGVVSSPMSATFSDVTSEPAASPVRTQANSVPRRKALLIGIKYYRNKHKKSLKGPHHDVREVQRLLQDVYGWDSECFRILKDDNGPKENQPTLRNIRHEIGRLVEDALPGDHLFFYFSGHGGQVADLDADEDDGKDEVIVSCDGELLVDDELHNILVKPLPAGCYLTALLDCCSSGTSLDLPYNALQSRDPAKHSSLIARKHKDPEHSHLPYMEGP